MSRSLHADMQTAVEDSVVRPFVFVDLNFSSPVYLWSGYGEITIGDNEYIGAGELLGISVMEESQDLGAKGLELNLSGISGTDLLSKALTEEYQGKTVTVKLGLFSNTGDVHNDPITIFSGFMDVLRIDEGGETSTISLAVENKLIQLNRSNKRRYTSQDQKRLYPNDEGFDYVTVMAEKDIEWGGRTEKAANQVREPVRDRHGNIIG